MSYRFREDAMRVRWHVVLVLAAAVFFLAFLGGVYLSAWTSLPIYLTFGTSAVLLGGWVVRRQRGALRRARSLRFEIDATQLTVDQDGQRRTIIAKENVRRVTHDADGVVTVYAGGWKPVFRVRLGDVESGQAFRQQLENWGSLTPVPRGMFSPPESVGHLLAVMVFLGLVLYVSEPAAVVAFGLITAVMLVAAMRVPWRHRNIEPAARRVLWAGALVGGIIAVRVLLLTLGG